MLDARSVSIGVKDHEEGDFCLPVREDNFLLHFSRQEYHPSGSFSDLTKRYCPCQPAPPPLTLIPNNKPYHNMYNHEDDDTTANKKDGKPKPKNVSP